MITSTHCDKMLHDVSLWYVTSAATESVAADDLRWRISLEEWLSGDSSPRPSAQTWQIEFVETNNFRLPRPTIAANQHASQWHWIVVWRLPDRGVADLMNRIARIRRTHPSCLQITAGLASPTERMFLTQVGVSAHLQQPHEWPTCVAPISRWRR